MTEIPGLIIFYDSIKIESDEDVQGEAHLGDKTIEKADEKKKQCLGLI